MAKKYNTKTIVSDDTSAVKAVMDKIGTDYYSILQWEKLSEAGKKFLLDSLGIIIESGLNKTPTPTPSPTNTPTPDPDLPPGWDRKNLYIRTPTR